MFRAADDPCSSERWGMWQFYHGGRQETEDSPSVHRVVLGHNPLPIFVFLGNGEQFLVGVRLARARKAFSAIMKNRQGRRALPLRQLPGKQRMLRLRIADEVGILLAVVVLPPGEHIVAVAVAQLPKKKVSAVLNRPVAQGVHSNADRQAGQRIVILGPRQHRSLITQPPDVAKKSKHQQRRGADGNSDLCPGKSHLREILYGWQITARLPPEAARGHVRMGKLGSNEVWHSELGVSQ